MVLLVWYYSVSVRYVGVRGGVADFGGIRKCVPLLVERNHLWSVMTGIRMTVFAVFWGVRFAHGTGRGVFRRLSGKMWQEIKEEGVAVSLVFFFFFSVLYQSLGC